jgi:CRP-like cAMP-binding protein
MNHSPNRLLAAVSTEITEALKPHLSLLEYRQGDVVAETGASVKNVYFPHSGVVSLVVELRVGDMIETAMVGRDGVVNASCALDGKVSLNKAIVQLGGFASVISIERFADIAERHRDLRALLVRHEQVVFAQAQQSGACNASHLVEARLCRWLLRMRDLASDDDLTVTQEFLAQMLGVRRSSLSIVANTLQKAGLIRYKRGHIRIVDVEGMKEGACECYETVRSYYERLLGPEKMPLPANS